MYNTNAVYRNDSPADYSRNSSYAVVGYSDSNTSESYAPLRSGHRDKSPCGCKGTCRTMKGCTCN